MNTALMKNERSEVTKKERRLTQITVALLSASIFMFSVWLSSGYNRDKLPIYLSVVIAIVIFWFAGIMLLKRSDKH